MLAVFNSVFKKPVRMILYSELVLGGVSNIRHLYEVDVLFIGVLGEKEMTMMELKGRRRINGKVTLSSVTINVAR